MNRSLLPEILRPGRSGGEGGGAGGGAAALLRARPSQYGLPSMGMSKIREGGEVGDGGWGVGFREEGQKKESPLMTAEGVCVLCWRVCLLICWVLFPLCGARWFGGQVIHHSGDAGDFLDLVYHL